MQRIQAPKLLPAEPALLHEAACWVDTWQEPSGHTNYEAALQLAERYLEADCCYIFSDGLSDYAVVLLEVFAHVLPGMASLLCNALFVTPNHQQSLAFVGAHACQCNTSSLRILHQLKSLFMLGLHGWSLLLLPHVAKKNLVMVMAEQQDMTFVQKSGKVEYYMTPDNIQDAPSRLCMTVWSSQNMQTVYQY